MVEVSLRRCGGVWLQMDGDTISEINDETEAADPSDKDKDKDKEAASAPPSKTKPKRKNSRAFSLQKKSFVFRTMPYAVGIHDLWTRFARSRGRDFGIRLRFFGDCGDESEILKRGFSRI